MITPGTTDDFLAHVFPGNSPAMDVFRADIDRLCRYCHRHKGSIGCVLVTGETGVGKNYTVKAISAYSAWLTLIEDEKRESGYCDQHGNILQPATMLVKNLLRSERKKGAGKPSGADTRLVTVLVPQLTGDLFGSELFGHAKGAFTGADTAHPGIFGDETVDDVFLDEIGDLPQPLQVKLLHVVETRTFRPVGGLGERTTAHRIFLATNKVLEELVETGQFREDLYWRIQGHRIDIPPLLVRRDVIEQLARSILESVNQEQRGSRSTGPSLDPDEEQYCFVFPEEKEQGRPVASNWVERFEPEDTNFLKTYTWPGNVRELRQCLELYVYYNGHRRLRDLVSRVTPSRKKVSSANGNNWPDWIERAVTAYLSAVMAGEESPPGRPDELLKRFDRLVKRAVCQFRNGAGTSAADMQKIFSNAKDWQTTVGKWDR
jgi:DNA-binding NtrC family response regulator